MNYTALKNAFLAALETYPIPPKIQIWGHTGYRRYEFLNTNISKLDPQNPSDQKLLLKYLYALIYCSSTKLKKLVFMNLIQNPTAKFEHNAENIQADNVTSEVFSADEIASTLANNRAHFIRQITGDAVLEVTTCYFLDIYALACAIIDAEAERVLFNNPVTREAEKNCLKKMLNKFEEPEKSFCLVM